MAITLSGRRFLCGLLEEFGNDFMHIDKRKENGAMQDYVRLFNRGSA